MILILEIDEGEAEAIALAISLQTDYLLIDEYTGRKVAERYGLKIIGILGVLIQAKQKGLILSVRAEMEKLKNQAGFKINPALFEDILRMVDEI